MFSSLLILSILVTLIALFSRGFQKKENADDKLVIKTTYEKEIVELHNIATLLEAERDKKLKLIGNIVHDSVPVSRNEVNYVYRVCFILVSWHVSECRFRDTLLF